MKIDFKVKKFFFDRKIVVDEFGAKGRKSLNALSRAGAFIRRRARSILGRKVKKVSSPGQPPNIHTSDQTLTLKNIQFAYDFSTSSMVVGTVIANGKSGGSQPVPQLLEQGGSASRRGKTLHYAPHPWMAPALEAELSNLPSHWAASVKG